MPIIYNISCCFIHVASCRDLNRYCSSWRRLGQCRKNPGYMNVYCKKSCGRCPRPPRPRPPTRPPRPPTQRPRPPTQRPRPPTQRPRPPTQRPQPPTLPPQPPSSEYVCNIVAKIIDMKVIYFRIRIRNNLFCIQ